MSIFIQNKYTRWYNNIISNAQARVLPKETYVEKHHIIPKSLNGVNDKTNLVKLTAKEHFVCHHLLIKMTTGLAKRSMCHAAWTMANLHNPVTQVRYKISSKTYEAIKTQNSKMLSDANTGKPGGTKGRAKSQEHKAKISATLKGHVYSEERNKKVSMALTGRKGSPRTKEWITNQKATILKNRKICEICNADVTKSTYVQYHGVKCNRINTII